MTLKNEHAKLGLPGYYEDDKGVEGSAKRAYIGWAPGADYMSARGWAENKLFESWDAFTSGWGVDGDTDLNLVADFYFTHDAATRECEPCEGSGYSPEGKRLLDCEFDYEVGFRDIVQEEVDVLVKEGRLKEGSTPGNQIGMSFGHDAINRIILIEARAKRLGIDHICPECKGRGRIDTEPENLILFVWMLHPRKGCGRGLTIKNIREVDLPAVKAWLRKSYENHTNHFQWALT